MCRISLRNENCFDYLKGIKSESVALVLTDPPYGMSVQSKDGCNGGGKQHRIPPSMMRPSQKERPLEARQYPQLIGDNSQDTARKHYENIKDMCKRQIIWGGQYFAEFLPVSGGWLFWDKCTGTNDFSDGELAYASCGKRVRKYTQCWNGVTRAGKQAYNLKRRVHPTQKPVELHAKILEDFTKAGDVVLDCFGGSGTTLIACEITGRKCLMMEISPEYCDVIRERYEELTRSALPLEVSNA